MHDNEMRTLLGDQLYDTLLKAVDEGMMSIHQGEDFAKKLHPSVGGNFLRAMEKNKHFDRYAMRKILSDWYDHMDEKVCENKEQARQYVLNILYLPNLNCGAIARKASKPSLITNALLLDSQMQAHVTSPTLGKISFSDSTKTLMILDFVPKCWPDGYANSHRLELSDTDCTSLLAWKDENKHEVYICIMEKVFRIRYKDDSINMAVFVDPKSKRIMMNKGEVKETAINLAVLPSRLFNCVKMGNWFAFEHLLTNMTSHDFQKVNAQRLLYTVCQHGATTCLKMLDKPGRIKVRRYA